MDETKFTAARYYSAAGERLALSTRLFAQGEFFASHYFAGIAVESMLRALALREGEPFDPSHSIRYWAGKATILPRNASDKQDELRADLLELNLRWRASQRYVTERMFLTWLFSVKLDRNVRGSDSDRLKFNSRRVLEIAVRVVGLGRVRWNQRN